MLDDMRLTIIAVRRGLIFFGIHDTLYPRFAGARYYVEVETI
jgi:hypothetical protein